MVWRNAPEPAGTTVTNVPLADKAGTATWLIYIKRNSGEFKK
jgi:hypothetical protein